MFLSIIIIGHNSENSLSQCLTSIKNQSYDGEDVEIVFVDDGSKDNSINIFKSFVCRFKTTLVEHRSNLGRNIARNTGIKRCLGKWCLFVNSNVVLSPNLLSVYISEIKKNKYNIFTSKIKYTCLDKSFELYLNQKNRGLNNLHSKQTIPYYNLLFSNACIKKTIMEKNNFDIDFTSYGGSELELSHRLSINHKFLFLPKIYVTRFNHPTLKTHIYRIEEFGSKNIFLLFSKLNDSLPKFLFYSKFFSFRVFILILPFILVIRKLLLFIYKILPPANYNLIVKFILGISLIIGIIKKKYEK